MNRLRLFALAVAVFAWAGTQGAEASLMTYDSASTVSVQGLYVWPANSGANYMFQQSNSAISGQTASASGDGSTPTSSVPTGTATASATAIAAPGILRMYGTTSASSGDPALYTESDANMSAYFNDQYMLESSTLPVGTYVKIGATIQLQDTISSTSSTGGPCTSASAVGGITLQGFGMTVYDSGCGTSPTSASTSLSVPIGSIADISGDLSAYSTSFAETGAGYGDFSSNTVNVMDTGSFFLTLPPGVTLVTGSGATYAPVSTVPLPSTFGLLVIGLLLLFAAPLRRRIAD